MQPGNRSKSKRRQTWRYVFGREGLTVMKKLSMVGFAMERGVTMTDEQLVYAVVEGRGQMQGREDSVMVAALPLALPGSELQQPLEIRTSSQQELTTAIVRLGGSLGTVPQLPGKGPRSCRGNCSHECNGRISRFTYIADTYHHCAEHNDQRNSSLRQIAVPFDSIFCFSRPGAARTEQNQILLFLFNWLTPASIGSSWLTLHRQALHGHSLTSSDGHHGSAGALSDFYLPRHSS